MRRFTFTLLFLFSTVCFSYENLEIDLESGTTMNITQFQGAGKTLLIWLPSERGFGKAYVPVALNLSMLDYDVWVAHLHDTYIIPTGRESLKEVEINDLLALMDRAKLQGFTEVYLVSTSRGAQLALKMAYLYQKKYQNLQLLKGLLMISPHLVKGKTEMGMDADYEDIASVSNLPIYLLQPQFGTKFARSREIVKRLERGGSPVFIQFLRGVRGGFHMRPNDHLTQQDLSVRDSLPQIFDSAISLLRHYKQAPLSKQIEINNNTKISEVKIKEPILHPFKGDKAAPSLILESLNGQVYDLTGLNDTVVLVNFWATWCGPCVEEIPSLSRLVESMEGKPFKVLAVNIGESADEINNFLESISVNFDILLDKNGNAVRDWKVYAYPSNFLLDKKGQIQYAYRGALKWDGPAIIETIESLF